MFQEPLQQVAQEPAPVNSVVELWHFLTTVGIRGAVLIVLTEFVAAMIGALFALIVTKRRIRREIAALYRHENHDDIDVQLHMVVDNTLLVRELPGVSDVNSVFSSLGAQELMRQVSREASIRNPVVPFACETRTLFEKLLGWVSSHNSDGKFDLGWYLIIPTYWDLPLDRTCVRVVVITEDELRKFQDWEWCVRLSLEAPTHHGRIIALHRLAIYCFCDGEVACDGDGVHRVGRRELAIRRDWKPRQRMVPAWRSQEAEALLKAAGLTVDPELTLVET
ncbi:MAG: hypothetical protein KDD44_12840 [Bdellovibrionales bacterium]|nr:hypothetical protein [Bdellovibrionales bacterium]